MKNCAQCSFYFRGSPVNYLNHHSIQIPKFLILAAILSLIIQETLSAGIPYASLLISKRIPDPQATEDAMGDLLEQGGVRYDEYPVVVPKRAAIIIDRILKQIEDAKDSQRLENDWGAQITRRGNKEKIYFRCYFNAVSCYRKK